jgi:hypothetical protein
MRSCRWMIFVKLLPHLSWTIYRFPSIAYIYPDISNANFTTYNDLYSEPIILRSQNFLVAPKITWCRYRKLMISKPTSNHHKLYQLLAVIVVLLISWFLGIRGINSDNIRRDELTTLGHIGALETDADGLSLSETIDSLATYSAQHPPLYFLSANIWGKYVSFDSFTLRLWSLFWGILSVAVLYRLAYDVGGRTVAIYASLLMATSVIFIFYTHELRQYSSLLFWVAMIWLLYHRLVGQSRPPRLIPLICLTLVTVCAIYTHYSAIFLLLVMGIYHLLFVAKNKAWWQISVAMILAGLTYIPWLPTMLSGLEVTVGKLEGGHPELLYNRELVEIISKFWGNGHELLFLSLIVLGIISAVFNSKNSRYALFYAVMIACAVLFVNGNFEFIKRIRYILVTLLPFFLLGGYGLAFLHRWRILPVLVLVVWVGVGAEFQTSGKFAGQTGLSGIRTYIEYNYLVPIVRDNFSSDDILLTVIKNANSMTKSKQDKMGIEAYYLSPLAIAYTNIHSNFAREYNLDKIVTKATPYVSIWITYRGTGHTIEQNEVIAAIEATHQFCKTINYGEESLLDQYVVIEQFERICQR